MLSVGIDVRSPRKPKQPVLGQLPRRQVCSNRPRRRFVLETKSHRGLTDPKPTKAREIALAMNDKYQGRRDRLSRVIDTPVSIRRSDRIYGRTITPGDPSVTTPEDLD